MTQICRWHIYPDVGDLVARAAQAIERCAAQAIAARGVFRIVLAGGNTPRAIYARLGQGDSRWPLWYVYFGDERCLPIDHAERNDVMARAAWLAHVPIPPRQIHTIPAERGAAAGAAAYAEVLREVGLFDLVLLGLGEDGHTASLFPGHPAHDGEDVLAVGGAPKPPSARVSLSAHRLGQAHQVMFFVTGATKRAAVTSWRAGADLPAARIAPPAGVDVLMDAAAWPS